MEVIKPFIQHFVSTASRNVSQIQKRKTNFALVISMITYGDTCFSVYNLLEFWHEFDFLQRNVDREFETCDRITWATNWFCFTALNYDTRNTRNPTQFTLDK